LKERGIKGVRWISDSRYNSKGKRGSAAPHTFRVGGGKKELSNQPYAFQP